MLKLLRTLPVVALASVIAAGASHAEGAAPAGDEAGLTRTLSAMFDAAEHEDQTRWLELTTPDFQAFENGRQYDQRAFFDLIKDAHAKGVHFSWSITQARSRGDGQLGILYYVNSGVIRRAGGEQAVKWLETAAFQRDHGRWRAFFVESARTADSPK